MAGLSNSIDNEHGNTNTKETKDMLKTSVTIAAVTLALVTAAVVVGIVNMMPIQYAKAANGDHCVGSGGSVACSGSGVHAVVVSLLQTSSVSQEGYQGGSSSASIDSKGLHGSCSSGSGSISTNLPGTSTSSGKGCS